MQPFHRALWTIPGPTTLIVVAKPLASLLGLDSFRALGLSISGVHSTLQGDEFEALTQELTNVFSSFLDKYKGMPISLNLDPQVAPIRLKARCVPLALRDKVDVELDKLLEQGVFEPVDHTKW